jgi:hypothetical protein
MGVRKVLPLWGRENPENPKEVLEPLLHNQACIFRMFGVRETSKKQEQNLVENCTACRSKNRWNAAGASVGGGKRIVRVLRFERLREGKIEASVDSGSFVFSGERVPGFCATRELRRIARGKNQDVRISSGANERNGY